MNFTFFEKRVMSLHLVYNFYIDFCRKPVHVQMAWFRTRLLLVTVETIQEESDLDKRNGKRISDTGLCCFRKERERWGVEEKKKGIYILYIYIYIYIYISEKKDQDVKRKNTTSTETKKKNVSARAKRKRKKKWEHP